MQYTMERYATNERFNAQYQEIHRFLLRAGELEYNEHFHWGRFEWMHRHAFLDKDKLTEIVIFRDSGGQIVGLITYDTGFDDRTYLIHTGEDAALLNLMVDTVLAGEENKAVIKVNSKDAALCAVLRERQFAKTHRDNAVLALDLSREVEYRVPGDYSISQPGFEADDWQYQLVIHRGFDNADIPEKWADEILAPTPNENAELKIFALQGGEYCAHCGLWYTAGDTAYVEPVVTLPRHRGQGLAKAVVYEACSRAQKLGARRATVLSDQEFYRRIGFEASSEVDCWEKEIISVREAKFEDMHRAADIMVTSFRTAFAEFVSPETMDACTNPDNCLCLLEHIYQEGKMRFLMGNNQGFLCWQEREDGAEIVAIHSLPGSWGTGLGHAMLTEALRQIGDRPVYLWAFKDNARARRFYEKHGFRWDGTERVSEFDGALEVRYVRK